ncbi:MAG: acetate--CoA ligase family protein [Nanoarchaeota archaeon]
MKIYTEKEAEDFLEKKGFRISRLFFAKDLKDIQKNKIIYPVVMKISSKNIVHKHDVNGIFLNINNYKEVVESFNKLKKIKGFEGVLFQKQIKSPEFLIGLKKTPEFGHVIAFGYGNTLKEKQENTCFRVCPITKKDAIDLINEVILNKKINKKPLVNFLIDLSNLSVKFSKIKELDVNPLFIEKDTPVIADAQIVFE